MYNKYMRGGVGRTFYSKHNKYKYIGGGDGQLELYYNSHKYYKLQGGDGNFIVNITNTNILKGGTDS